MNDEWDAALLMSDSVYTRTKRSFLAASASASSTPRKKKPVRAETSASSASRAKRAPCTPGPSGRFRQPQRRRAARAAEEATQGGVKGAAFHAHLDVHRWPCASAGRVITIGSDCSGLDSVMAALDQMGLSSRVKLMFCSDTERSCRRFLRGVHDPARLYHDIVCRNVERVPHVDIYTAGFPCQPYSQAGLRQGRKDKHGRGTCSDHVLEYIAVKTPKAFLLENVAALTSVVHKKVFEQMLAQLRASGLYFVSWRCFNALHFGLPQNRNRVFILGLLRSAVPVASFPWPKPLQRTPLPLKKFLCGGVGVIMEEPSPGTRAHLQRELLLQQVKAKGGVPETMPYAMDIFSGRNAHCMLDRVPCLTRSRAGSGGYYISCLRRCLTVEEMLNLQGLPVAYVERARPLGITDRQLAQMVGNAIPTTVLQVLLCRIITTLGLHK